MASRYDQAAPVRDTYFNTFVPLPLDQLTALGMSRQKDLEQNEALLEKSYENAVDIKYANESPADEAHYRNIVKSFSDIASKYSKADLSNGLERSNMLRELRSTVDPALVKNMEGSWAANQQKKAMIAELKSRGQWNEKLNTDPISQHNSATGTFNWMPEAYMGREKLLGPYMDKIHPTFKGIEMRNGMPFIIHGVRNEDINKVANERAGELISTPAGQQEIKLFKADYPDVASKMTDIQIMNQIMRDYGQTYEQGEPLSGEMAKMWAAGQQGGDTGARPLHGINAGEVTRFDSLSSVKSKIKELEELGDSQGASDLQKNLDYQLKKNKVSKEDVDNYFKSADTMNETMMAPGDFPTVNILKGNEIKNREGIKATLDALSSTKSTKYSSGFPAYTSSDLSLMVNPVTGEKRGVNDLHYMSNMFITNPSGFEVLDVNNKGILSNKKLDKILSQINTKELENANVEVSPNSKYEYKPVMTLFYNHQSSDGKNVRNKIKFAINDPTNAEALAKVLINRGDYSTAAGIVQPHVAQSIMTDNFDTEKTYSLTQYVPGTTTPESQSTIKIRQLDDPSQFEIMDKVSGESAIVNGRYELVAKIYDLIGENGGWFDKVGEK